MTRGLTFEILQRLLQENLLPVQFTALANAYGIEISNATISRVIKNGQFNNHETDQMLRPLILKLDDLVQRAAPFKVSFEDAEATKLVLDVIDLGVDLTVGAPISINSTKEATAVSSDNTADGGDQLNSIKEFANDRRAVS